MQPQLQLQQAPAVASSSSSSISTSESSEAQDMLSSSYKLVGGASKVALARKIRLAALRRSASEEVE